ncbi:glyoxalase family protein [Alkalibacillus filiformis]|uniref:Glyoxalase family protein n=1 Tax=Alkalibacillus filiformis TaxID=200990 RepID=A0ABU0DUL0_9BACI|nr:ring-cleaving dioxygenase [Alkalibacillus filiformis]MDQ0352146.1 glyoxalase family protein [Alkalibacillus filiformis]
MELLGIHHLSAMTKNAQDNVDFYTKVLGMRLVKKTVNQDDPSMYHLFYGDEVGNPGTELTFFEMDQIGQNHDGNNSISTTSLRVPNDEALKYWEERLTHLDVEHEGIVEQFGRRVIPFRDHEKQRLMLVSDEKNEGVSGGIPWQQSKADPQHGVIGLGPIHLTIPDLERTEAVLTEVMGFRRSGTYEFTQTENEVVVFETGEGGAGAELHVHVSPNLHPERLGRGGVHHVAFRVQSEEELYQWIDRLNQSKLGNSGFVDRYYFKSVYFREPNGILFELATDGPGFTTDEDELNLGETLALPPFLEEKREEITKNLKPINY